MQYKCYDCDYIADVDMQEAYFVIGYGDYAVECMGTNEHVLINLDNDKEMVV